MTSLHAQKLRVPAQAEAQQPGLQPVTQVPRAETVPLALLSLWHSSSQPSPGLGHPAWPRRA